MRKGVVIFLNTMLVLALVMCTGCGGEKEGGNKKLLALLPGDAAGVLSLDFKSLSSFNRKDLFDLIIKEIEKNQAGKSETKFDYKQFVSLTGVEPHKDIHGFVVAYFDDLDRLAEKKEFPDLLVLMELDCDGEKLLTILKTASKTIEESFNGISIFIDQDNQKIAAAFLDAGTMAMGAPELLKKAILRFKQTEPAPLPDTGLNTYIRAFKPGVFASLAMNVPATVKKIHEAGMYQVDLSNAEAFLVHVHISGDTPITAGALSGGITLIRHDEERNKQLLNILNGAKAMAALGGPEAVEAVKHIDFHADAGKVSMDFSFSTEIMEKLAQLNRTTTAPPPGKQQ